MVGRADVTSPAPPEQSQQKDTSLRFRLTRLAGPVLVPLGGLVLALAIWQGLSGVIGEFTLPPPFVVFDVLWANLFESAYLEGIGLTSGGYFPHLLSTTRNVFVGLGLGAFLGISIGLLSVPIKGLGQIVDTFAVPVVVSPVVVIIPFFLIWFGVVAGAQIMIVAFYATFLLYIYSKRAAQNIRPYYVESALTLGAQRWSVFRQIYLPAVVPEIAAGIRVALAGAWGLAAVSELIGAQAGIGFLIRFYAGAFRVDAMLALVLFLGAVAILVDRLLVLVIRRVTRWSEAGRRLEL